MQLDGDTAPMQTEQRPIESLQPATGFAPVTSIHARDARRAEEAEDLHTQREQADTQIRAELVRAEQQIEDLIKAGGRSMWDLGRALAEISEKELWIDSGDYKSFGDYATKRFAISRTTVRDCIRVTEVFDRKAAGEFPAGHLRLLSKLPDEIRPALIDFAREEQPTFRALQARCKAEKAERGLDVTRTGHVGDGSIRLHIDPGVVAEGQWHKTRGRNAQRIAKFTLGTHAFELRDCGTDGFVVSFVAEAATEG